MALQFQYDPALHEPHWRPSNHWKSRPLTSTPRVRCHAAVKVEMDVGAASTMDTAQVTRRLAGKAGGCSRQEGVERGGVKVALQPNVLSFGQNGSERLRVTRVQRPHSAGQDRGGGWRISKASGSPYLEEQQLHGVHVPRHQPRTSRQHRDVPRKQGGTSQNHQQRRPSEEERIGRCQPGNPMPQLYKAALALMQAQRQRAPPVHTPSPSPASPRSTHHHQYHHNHHRYDNPHDYYHPHSHHSRYALQRDSFPHHRQPGKSILRQTSVPSLHGTQSYRSRPYSSHSNLSIDSRGWGMSQSPRQGSRKKVTFGEDVVVQLTEDTGSTQRLTHRAE